MNRLKKVRDNADFDTRYQEQIQRKLGETQRLEDDKWNRDAEDCTFTPSINEVSRALNDKTQRPPLHKRYQDELKVKNEKLKKERDRVQKQREVEDLKETRERDIR